jgi:hypothetical protein
MITIENVPFLQQFNGFCHEFDQIYGRDIPPADWKKIKKSLDGVRIAIQKQQDQMALLEQHIQDQQNDIAALKTDNNDLRQANANLDESNQQLQDNIENYREREARIRKLLANKNISAAHKLILMHIEDEAGRRRPELTDVIRIDMTAVGSATGLSRYTVGDKVRDLADWGAIEKTSEKVKVEKKGKKIEVDHVSVALNQMFLIAPEDIRPVKDGEEYDRNHGGKRERCRRCKSVNIQRLHHIRCFDCGEEYISTSEEHTQDALLSVSQVATRIPSEPETIRESSCHSDQDDTLTTSGSNIRESSCHSDADQSDSLSTSSSPALAASVSQVATRILPPTNTQSQTDSLSLSLEEKLTDEEADFWIRWRALTGESRLNETAYKHIQELACITNNQDLQSLYDTAYQRLEEFAKSQNKKAVPPRLGNLVNCLPEWKQTQKRRDQERVEKEQAQEHVPGTGKLTNWTQRRMTGEDIPPLVYTRLDPPARTKKSTQNGGLSKVTFSDLPLKGRGRNER